MKKLLFLTLFAVIGTAFSFSQVTTWKNDPAHSRLGFYVKHLTVSEIDGRFSDFDVNVTINGEDYTKAKIVLIAQTASINTDVEARDNHLRSADFFDVAQFPTLTFTSTSFTKSTDSEGVLTGNLTMRGVTRHVVLKVTYFGTVTNPMNNQKTAGFQITGSINRKDFGIGDSFPNTVVGDEIDIVANVEFSPIN